MEVLYKTTLGEGAEYVLRVSDFPGYFSNDLPFGHKMSSSTSSSPSLTGLAKTIQTHTATLSAYLKQNSLPPVSLDADAYPFFPGSGPADVDPSPRLTEEVRNARAELRDACTTLLQLVSGPAEAFFTHATGHFQSAALQVIYHFHLAEGVPIDGEISYQQLATKCGLAENHCTRVLKLAMTQNVFRQPRPGYVAHTALSKMLLNPDMSDMTGYILEESFFSAGRISETFEKYPGSEEKNTTTWNLGHNIDLPMFEFFEKHPARMQRFLGCMRSVAAGEAYSIEHLAYGYDWKGLGTGVVVDVGGSFGHCCSVIANVAPDLNFIVQDLDQVVAEAQRQRANGNGNGSDKGTAAKIEFQAHNFFTPQPVKNADVYLLRFICHDYSDKYAAQILSSITPAMGPNSRIMIVDGLMPEVGVMSKFDEQRLR